jgi:Ring finger domain/zinc-ribbon
MQSNTQKLYYCYSCSKSVMIDYPNLACPDCGSDFLQEANMSEIEPTLSREVTFMDIISIFTETRDPVVRRNRLLARISEDRNRAPESRSFRIMLRELLERSGRPVPDSLESAQHIKNLVVEEINGKECKICAEVFNVGEEIQVLPCEHEYHSCCLQPWLKLKNSCPACRHSI